MWSGERFDQMLLDNAADKGVEVHRGVRVRDVVFEGDRAVGVRVMHDRRRTVPMAMAPIKSSARR